MTLMMMIVVVIRIMSEEIATHCRNLPTKGSPFFENSLVRLPLPSQPLIEKKGKLSKCKTDIFFKEGGAKICFLAGDQDWGVLAHGNTGPFQL